MGQAERGEGMRASMVQQSRKPSKTNGVQSRRQHPRLIAFGSSSCDSSIAARRAQLASGNTAVRGRSHVRLGIPVYQGVNLLDVAGPLEMFYWAGQEMNGDRMGTRLN